LDRRQDFSGQILNKVQRVISWPWLGLQPVRTRRLAFAAAVVALSIGLFALYQNRPIERVTIGKFAAIVGTPSVQHTGQRSTLHAPGSTPANLGDRIVIGYADKAEIRFNYGTLMQLNFNTNLEILRSIIRLFNASSYRH